jgi:hypothetical protein
VGAAFKLQKVSEPRKGAPITLLTEKALKKASRDQLEQEYHKRRAIENEWIRRQVIDNNRIDILATEILGMDLRPFHYKILRFQFMHKDSLQLVFRGAGKTTVGTVVKAIHYLLKNPNLRILIYSKTIQFAKAILGEIKSHFENNARMKEVFGAYHDPLLVKKWDETEIRVLPRTSNAKESSITAIGVGGQVVGKHYDVLLGDDVVDEENSATKLQREKILTWNYKSLEPTLEPPSPDVEHRGEHHRQGTRYHFDDLWGHLIKNELKDSHQIIRALNDKGQSPWPEKYPPEWFHEKRRKSGLIIFNSQYQNDTEAMKGEIFPYDYCQQLGPDDFPETADKLRVFMGVDLAIKQTEDADKFAIVVIGVTADRSQCFFLDWFEGHLRFSAQTAKIIEFAERWDPIRVGLEVNAYQEAQKQVLEDAENKGLTEIRLKGFQTDEDKRKRAWKRTHWFENKRMFFRRQHELLVEHFVLFTGKKGTPCDTFDAFDLAMRAMEKKSRRVRRSEPGIL